MLDEAVKTVYLLDRKEMTLINPLSQGWLKAS